MLIKFQYLALHICARYIESEEIKLGSIPRKCMIYILCFWCDFFVELRRHLWGLSEHTLLFFHQGRVYKWNQIRYENYTDVFMNRHAIFFQNKWAISTIWSLWFQSTVIFVFVLVFQYGNYRVDGDSGNIFGMLLVMWQTYVGMFPFFFFFWHLENLH